MLFFPLKGNHIHFTQQHPHLLLLLYSHFMFPLSVAFLGILLFVLIVFMKIVSQKMLYFCVNDCSCSRYEINEFHR